MSLPLISSGSFPWIPFDFKIRDVMMALLISEATVLLLLRIPFGIHLPASMQQ